MTKDKSQEFTEQLEGVKQWLDSRHIADNTIQVYSFTVQQFFTLYGRPDYKNLLLYKCFLLEHYKPQTVNLRIPALNSFMEYLKIPGSKVSILKLQGKPFQKT